MLWGLAAAERREAGGHWRLDRAGVWDHQLSSRAEDAAGSCDSSSAAAAASQQVADACMARLAAAVSAGMHELRPQGIAMAVWACGRRRGSGGAGRSRFGGSTGRAGTDAGTSSNEGEGEGDEDAEEEGDGGEEEEWELDGMIWGPREVPDDVAAVGDDDDGTRRPAGPAPTTVTWGASPLQRLQHFAVPQAAASQLLTSALTQVSVPQTVGCLLMPLWKCVLTQHLSLVHF